MVINRAKFDVCAYSSFRGVKTDTQTDRIALYILDAKAHDFKITAGVFFKQHSNASDADVSKDAKFCNSTR